MSCATKSFIEKMQGFGDISRVSGWRWPASLHILWLELFLARLASFVFFFFQSESFLWDLWQQEVSCSLWHGDGWDAGGALEPWESVVGALPSFLGVALEEPLWLLSPPEQLAFDNPQSDSDTTAYGHSPRHLTPHELGSPMEVAVEVHMRESEVEDL